MKEDVNILNPNLGVGALEPAAVSKGWGGPFVVLGYCIFFFTLKSVMGIVSPIHLLYLGSILILYFLHRWTRTLAVICIPMIIYATIFDFFTLIPFSALLPIHVEDIYYLDLSLFGVSVGGASLLLNEYVYQLMAHPFWDVVSAIIYFLHIPAVIGLILYFWYKYSIGLAQRYTLGFLIVNILAFSTYYIYPAAAPWYVAKFSFLAPMDPIPGDPAGLVGLEKILGITLFSDNYAISPVVFGAMPSMHVGYAALGWLFSFHGGRWVRSIMTVYLMAMIFSALYLQHHYFIDLVVGFLYAVITWLLVDIIFFKGANRVNRWILSLFSGRAQGLLIR